MLGSKSRMNLSFETFPNCIITRSGSVRFISWKFLTLASLTRPPKLRHQHCRISCQCGGTFLRVRLWGSLSASSTSLHSLDSIRSSASSDVTEASDSLEECSPATGTAWAASMELCIFWRSASLESTLASLAGYWNPCRCGSFTSILRGPRIPKKLRLYFMLPMVVLGCGFEDDATPEQDKEFFHTFPDGVRKSSYPVPRTLVFKNEMQSPSTSSGLYSGHRRIINRCFPNLFIWVAASRNFSRCSGSGSPKYKKYCVCPRLCFSRISSA
mmetsp:Transcript_40755/g.96925  ORF Transcript_40755/g.96925 Transcript_40755/m.96925 type:complete len:270 (+) Transcript_40755:293-1102(+)